MFDDLEGDDVLAGELLLEGELDLTAGLLLLEGEELLIDGLLDLDGELDLTDGELLLEGDELLIVEELLLPEGLLLIDGELLLEGVASKLLVEDDDGVDLTVLLLPFVLDGEVVVLVLWLLPLPLVEGEVIAEPLEGVVTLTFPLLSVLAEFKLLPLL